MVDFNAKRNIPEFSNLIEEQGGFGKVQLLSFLLLVSGINSYGWQQYNVNYITLYPDYKCTEQQEGNPDLPWMPIDNYKSDKCQLDIDHCHCKPDYFCENTDTVAFEVDYENEFTIHNFVTEYQLTCESKLYISMFQSAFFIGAAAGSFIFPPLSDIYGRRKIFLFTILCTVLLTIIQLVLPSGNGKLWALWLLCVNFGFNGTLSQGRKSIGFCYIVELVP